MLMKSKLTAAATVAAFAITQLSPSLPPRFGQASAAEAPPEIAVAVTPPPPLVGDPVVFVVVDGVRWQEIFLGVDHALARGTGTPRLDAESLTPNLHAIRAERGAAIGAPGYGVVSASGPRFVSLPSYREIFSGTSSLDCLDNECAPITRTTLIDELRSRGGSAAVFSSWERIDRAAAKDPGAVVMSAGRDPSEAAIDPHPGSGAFRPDRLTAERGLKHLETARPDFLFLGLGEPDEYAHHGDYSGYVDAIRAADRVVGQLRATLARMGPRGQRTHVFVTADHGRATTFRHHGGDAESARVWLFAWGPTFRARGAVATDAARRLADLAPTARVVLGLPQAPASVHTGRPLNELFAAR